VVTGSGFYVGWGKDSRIDRWSRVGSSRSGGLSLFLSRMGYKGSSSP